MEIGNIIKGPGARAPQFKVSKFTDKNIVCVDAYGKRKFFPIRMTPVFSVLF